MAPLLPQNAWSVALEKARNSASRSSNNNQGAPEGAPQAQPVDAVTTSIQTATLQAVRFMVTSSIPSFGLTWILLTLYTLIKDLTGLRFLADPGDVVFVFMPTKTIASLPESVKSLPRLASRLFIYPIGILLMAAYGCLIVLLIMLIMALVNPLGTIARLYGIQL